MFLINSELTSCPVISIFVASSRQYIIIKSYGKVCYDLNLAKYHRSWIQIFKKTYLVGRRYKGVLSELFVDVWHFYVPVTNWISFYLDNNLKKNA